MAASVRPDSKPRRPLILIGVVLIVLLCGVGIILLLFPSLQYDVINAGRYDAVIRMIQAGTISGGSSTGEWVTLPPAYQDLSPAHSGAVQIYRDGATLRVLFYPPRTCPSQGLCIGGEVYMYYSESAPSAFLDECQRIAHLRPNWYLLSCP